MPQGGPRIDVVGLGPAGPELVTTEAVTLMTAAEAVFLRTRRHPAAAVLPGVRSFDHLYESGETLDSVYRSIVRQLVAAAGDWGTVVYAVPGSPAVAERTVVLLREEPAVRSGEVTLVVHPSLSFLDLAFERLGLDPVATGVRVVDGESFAVDAAADRGPLLVAQCWSLSVLSDIKLSVEPIPGATVTVLYHLGLADEQVWSLPWDELDRSFDPDHLTSLWIPHLGAPVAAELVRLDDLVRTLRQRCPWDRAQTHGSLGRHLLEESYEALEAIDAVADLDAGTAVGLDAERAVAHLEEELGDLLFQVYFHALLGAEAGRFTLADVARGVHDKLVSRHPHVFGAMIGAEGVEQPVPDWEALKKAEKNRSSVTEGIPPALPALALAAKLQRKALAVGMVLPDVAAEAERVAHGVAVIAAGEGGGRPAGEHGGYHGDDHGDDRGGSAHGGDLGDALFSLANMARSLGIDPESALRSRAARFRASVEARG